MPAIHYIASFSPGCHHPLAMTSWLGWHQARVCVFVCMFAVFSASSHLMRFAMINKKGNTNFQAQDLKTPSFAAAGRDETKYPFHLETLSNMPKLKLQLWQAHELKCGAVVSSLTHTHNHRLRHTVTQST